MEHQVPGTNPDNYLTKTAATKDAAQFTEQYNIDKNTDELEGLLTATNAKLDTFIAQQGSDLSAIRTTLEAISSSLGTVTSKLTVANNLLQDIKTNTTPAE